MLIRGFRHLNSSKILNELMHARSWRSLYPLIEKSKEEISAFDKGATIQCEKSFIFSKIPDSEVDSTLDVLTDIIIKREPLALAVNFSQEEFRGIICERFLKASDFTKLSIKVTKGNEPVGVFIALDWRNQNRLPIESQFEKDTWDKFEPIAMFLNKGNLIHINDLGVAVHDTTGGVFEQFERQGVATKVLALRIALAVHHGFQYYIAESGFGCSHAYKVYAKFLEFGSEMRFADFSFKGEKVFADLQGGYVLHCRQINKP